MSEFKTGWYVIYTKPRHEKKVHARLSELHLETFLPTRKVLRHWNDRMKFIEEPLFPSYVFIHLTDMAGFYTGKDTDGALYYVRLGQSPARVNESVVNNIKLIADQAKDLEVSEKRFTPGRKLIITQGALSGLSCELVQVDDRARLLVRIDLLKRNILLSLPEEQLVVI